MTKARKLLNKEKKSQRIKPTKSMKIAKLSYQNESQVKPLFQVIRGGHRNYDRKVRFISGSGPVLSWKMDQMGRNRVHRWEQMRVCWRWMRVMKMKSRRIWSVWPMKHFHLPLGPIPLIISLKQPAIKSHRITSRALNWSFWPTRKTMAVRKTHSMSTVSRTLPSIRITKRLILRLERSGSRTAVSKTVTGPLQTS